MGERKEMRKGTKKEKELEKTSDRISVLVQRFLHNKMILSVSNSFIPECIGYFVICAFCAGTNV